MSIHTRTSRRSITRTTSSIAPAKKKKNQLSRHNSSGTSRSSSSSKLCCDKCNGKHLTDECPVYRKPREKHRDAYVNYGRKKPKQIGGGGGNFVIKSLNARVIRQVKYMRILFAIIPIY